jgi:glycosyltransferase involved in cell wall biosynthesis
MTQPPKLNVAVLTYNRPQMLRQTLDSILAQDFPDFRVIVLDNASTDDTPQVVQSYVERDARVRHERNVKNIGMMRNWNRAFARNRSPFICVFHDDDIMLPGFLAKTVAALERYPSAGFAVVEMQYIDQSGAVIGLHDFAELPKGMMSGLNLLELAVEGRYLGMFPPTMVMRASALAGVGPLDSPHTKYQDDINFYNRVAAKSDVVLIPEVLVQYRVHGGSDTAAMRDGCAIAGWYGENSERIDAATLLLESDRAADPAYRRWLAKRIRDLHLRKSAAVHMVLPSLYYDWQTRSDVLQDQLRALIPAGQTMILVDDTQLALPNEWEGRRLLPFLERDGVYWGAPANDDQAIAHLQRLMQQGAKWIVFAWPSLWWTDEYRRFHRHLTTNFPCRLDTAYAKAFELRPIDRSGDAR